MRQAPSPDLLRAVRYFAIGATLMAATQSASAAVVITEVDPYGSNDTAYASDWFELTNTGSTAVNISGWTMIDAHAYTGSGGNNVAPTSTYNLSNVSINNSTKGTAALTLASGLTSIAAGQSVVFLENPTGTTLATSISNFDTAWFGGSGNVPTTLVFGAYNDGGSAGNGNFGLGTSGDMVNIFSTASATTATLIASVATASESTTPTPVTTFDNTAGLNDVVLGTKSAIGVNGAFESTNGLEIGSPGVAAVPLPATAWLFISGLVGVGAATRKRKAG